MLNINKQEFSQNFRNILQQTGQIPPLSETTRELIKLRNNSDSSLPQLIDLINQDPGLSAFILKYARMSSFGYGDRIVSVHQAVSLVLGFNSALNLSMSISASGCLRMPNHGALGKICIWSQALECAVMCRELYHLSGIKRSLNGDIAYLSGLFHNFGYMLFSHLYPREFSYLNDLVTQHPEQDARVLQLQVFGITHDTIGMYLIKAWNLPEEIVTTVAEQHFPDYSGRHALYVKLLALANRMLRDKDIIDGCPYVDTAVLLGDLEIDEFSVLNALTTVRGYQQEFKALAQSLAV